MFKQIPKYCNQIIKNTQINCKIRLSQIFKLIKPNKIVKLSFKTDFGKTAFQGSIRIMQKKVN